MFCAGVLLAASPAMADVNPFFQKSPLQYQAPQFDRIKIADFAPALEEGMKREIAEIDAIANDPAPPTFANTLEAMERSGRLLNRVSSVFSNLAQSNTNEAMQRIRAEEAPKLARHQDAIYLNAKLWARVKAIYEKRDALGLDPESRYLLERYRVRFVRAGAELPDADKAKLRALNEEQAKLTTRFEEAVLADTKTSCVVVAEKDELAGLREADVASAAAAAKERGLAGKWVIVLRNTTQQPALSSLTNRALRQRILRASEARCGRGGPDDTKAIVTRLAQLRAQKAKLFGFPTFAAYVLDDQMAKTPEKALKLLTDLAPAATAKAGREAARMQKLIDAEKGDFTLGASDWQLYAAKARQADYDVDEAQVRPYFPLERVLQDGVFFAAHELYGLTFKERRDLPVYHPDVRVFEVFDADGTSLALFYADFFQRTGKSGGAWCDEFVGQSTLLGTRPVIVNVLNFGKPAAGDAALLPFDDVQTLFHEFGHALHGMFSNVRYPMLSGTPRDWVELPSQFNEHWSLEPAVLTRYARHFETGEPIPPALVEKIRKTKTLGMGYATTEYLEAALLDLAWHTLPADAPPQTEVEAFERTALDRFRVNLPQVPPRYRTTYFSHIWGGGYAAGYYAYLWSEVLDHDAYYWFKEHGGMTRANGQRFRDMILSRGGTAEAAGMYRAFRGRDPIVQPLLQERGLVAE
jgi:peptidyl-dipeptidase Dcp